MSIIVRSHTVPPAGGGDLDRLARWSIRSAAATQGWAAVAPAGAVFDQWWPAALGLVALVWLCSVSLARVSPSPAPVTVL